MQKSLPEWKNPTEEILTWARRSLLLMPKLDLLCF